jgi:hypothetical protein
MNLDDKKACCFEILFNVPAGMSTEACAASATFE